MHRRGQHDAGRGRRRLHERRRDRQRHQPLLGGRRPARLRRRQTSDLNDPDDDNDGLPDTSDPFAIDPNNGKTTTTPPVSYTWDNDAPSPGGLLNLGFTGLMTNGTSELRSPSSTRRR